MLLAHCQFASPKAGASLVVAMATGSSAALTAGICCCGQQCREDLESFQAHDGHHWCLDLPGLSGLEYNFFCKFLCYSVLMCWKFEI